MNPLTHPELFMELANLQEKDVVNIKGTLETPQILLNKNDGTMKFAGRSLPENPKLFYAPFKNWLAVYVENPKPYTHVTFMFDYINTTSSKMVMELIDIFKKVEERNGRLIIDWYYQQDDEDMLESGEDFEQVTGSEFNYHSYP